MLLRNNSGVLYRSLSDDGGVTWGEATPTNLKTPVSPASCKMLPGTNTLLLLWNDHENIPEALKDKRTPFTLACSKDSGETWLARFTLEDNPSGWYCYTAIEFTKTHALLAYCAGDTRKMPGLSLTRIARIPIEILKEM